MIILGAAIAGSGHAATVRFTLVPRNVDGSVVTVTPGAEVPFDVFAEVTSDDPAAPDNNGLAFFSMAVDTNLGVTQRPLDAFSQTVGPAFPLVQSLGRAVDDDIEEIGGGQNTFGGNAAVAGIGVGEPELLGSGRFLTPASEGTFDVQVRSVPSANVFAPNVTSGAQAATVEIGPGFTIITSQPAADDDDDDTDGDDEDDDRTPTTQPTTRPSGGAGVPISTGILIGGGILAAFLGALFLGGPLAGMIMLVIAPLVAFFFIMAQAGGA
jgi:hypothetical protein